MFPGWEHPSMVPALLVAGGASEESTVVQHTGLALFSILESLSSGIPLEREQQRPGIPQGNP